MKIAFFTSTVDCTTGTGNLINEICQEFSKKGISFVVFAPKSEKSQNIETKFETRYVLPEFVFSVKRKSFLSYLFSNINLKEFDLIHCFFEFPYSILAARLAKKYKIPLIISAQGTFAVRPLTACPEKYFLKWSYKSADEIVVPSQFTKDKIQEYSGKKYNISIIHNGVNFDRFYKDIDITDLKEKYKGKKILITVGGLKARKGQDLVIKSLIAVKKQYPNFKYLIIGAGKWKNYLEQLVKENNLDDFVEFIGSLNGENLVKYFHLCDVYVHTPRIQGLSFEGFGIVYLEASACGKPIVAADAGGIRDAVLDGKTGLIAKNENIEEISKHILTLLQDENLAKSLGQAGIEYSKKHKWEIIADKFVSVYKKYLK